MANEKQMARLLLALGLVAFGCVLQIAQIYVLGTVIMLVGLAIYYPARNAVRHRSEYSVASKPVLKPSRGFGFLIGGLLLLTVIGGHQLATRLSPVKGAVAFISVVLLGVFGIYLVLRSANKR